MQVNIECDEKAKAVKLFKDLTEKEMFRAKIVELLSDLVDAVKSALPKNTQEEVEGE